MGGIKCVPGDVVVDRSPFEILIIYFVIKFKNSKLMCSYKFSYFLYSEAKIHAVSVLPIGTYEEYGGGGYFPLKCYQPFRYVIMQVIPAENETTNISRI